MMLGNTIGVVERFYPEREAIDAFFKKLDFVALYMEVKEQKEFLDGAFIVDWRDEHNNSLIAAYKGDRTLVVSFTPHDVYKGFNEKWPG